MPVRIIWRSREIDDVEGLRWPNEIRPEFDLLLDGAVAQGCREFTASRSFQRKRPRSSLPRRPGRRDAGSVAARIRWEEAEIDCEGSGRSWRGARLERERTRVRKAYRGASEKA